MKLLPLLLISVSASAANLIVTAPTANIKAGSQVAVSITLANTAGTGDQALQFSITGLAWPYSYSAGAALAAAGKSLTCATVGAAINCIAYGGNTLLTEGAIATVTFTVPLLSPTGTATGTIFNVLAATTDASGNIIGAQVVAPGPFSLSIISLPTCDLNGDKRFDSTDRSILIPQVLGAAACVNDLNSDGKCDVLDVQILEGAIATGVCVAK